MPMLRLPLIDFSDDERQQIESFVGANLVPMFGYETSDGRHNDPLELPISIAPTPAQIGVERDPHVIEKVGGPGRTRTCDNTVMSGAF